MPVAWAPCQTRSQETSLGPSTPSFAQPLARLFADGKGEGNNGFVWTGRCKSLFKLVSSSSYSFNQSRELYLHEIILLTKIVNSSFIKLFF